MDSLTRIGMAAVVGLLLSSSLLSFAEEDELIDIVDPVSSAEQEVTERVEYTEVEVVEELVQQDAAESQARSEESEKEIVTQPLLIDPKTEEIEAVVIQADVPGPEIIKKDEFVILESKPLDTGTPQNVPSAERNSNLIDPQRADRSTVETIPFKPMDLQALAEMGIDGALDAPDLDRSDDPQAPVSPLSDEQAREQLRKYDTREDLGRFNVPTEFRLRPAPVDVTGRTYNYDYLISTPR
ncbi:hypothetical protein [Allohahella sp. A8]|uniref:hypothetical protein n=1 Tax=Allohahella sp. A8 TaxID=3141461 RepID=UPI000C0A5DB4|nr:hypothetical protein [Hahellaceae bacterium]